MKKLCVFCGSAPGKGEQYIESAKNLGESLQKNQIGLVYGGASVGVMAAVADACLAGGGKVWGVIPESLVKWEVAHDNLTDLLVVDSMHERKQKMYDLSDAFVALPGGFGTLDELCEILTWAQLKYHAKPIYLLNENGFYDYLLKHFHHINDEGFLREGHLDLVIEVKSVEELMEKLSQLPNEGA
ncbi:MAG: TIGR00730 family Rossman fold protein [Deltaproteobacteria bacterium]|nr:MAG: TIGR00730 family Rossman fold protein [Deltaproteobacteria bacterium]